MLFVHFKIIHLLDLKKMKSKGFARSVSREDIVDGAAGLGVDLGAHVTFVIDALRGIAPQLGL